MTGSSVCLLLLSSFPAQPSLFEVLAVRPGGSCAAQEEADELSMVGALTGAGVPAGGLVPPRCFL